MATNPRTLRNTRSVGIRDIIMSGQVLITAAGAITSQTGMAKCGFTVTKNAAAGRYDVLFYKAFANFKGRHASMELAGGGAFPTTTGIDPQFRPGGTTSDKVSAQVQFTRHDTKADADTASGNILFITIIATEVV